MSIQAIKMTLSGKLAFFKKPDVNAKAYFTYNNIHKVALLGMLGAILGLKGYRSTKVFGDREADYPEFYQKLSSMKVSIVPNSRKGYFPKKIQYFNNSVGYASEEEGGNLMVYEQWLENPNWTIYLLNDGGIQEDLWNKLMKFLLHGKAVYVPYLGKNDFSADISDTELVELHPCSTPDFVQSLFIGELGDIDEDDISGPEPLPFLFTEFTPVSLEKNYNFYVMKRSIFTNCRVNRELKDVYSVGGSNLYFY